MTASFEEGATRDYPGITTETLSVSIGELINLFQEGSLVIRPGFQRLYRWNAQQKSNLVESILLGIPIPALIVAQTEVGKWEIVDGLQRVSALLEFQGVSLDGAGWSHEKLRLVATKYLPDLDGKTWDGSDGATSLAEVQRRRIRMYRIDLRVIKHDVDSKMSAEVFQRINSYGSALTAQELRSSMMAAANQECSDWLAGLAGYEPFRACTAISSRQVMEQFDIELILRFLMLHNYILGEREMGLTGISERLDQWSLELAENFEYERHGLEGVFHRTFDLVAAAGNADVFRKWDDRTAAFRGPLQLAAFDAIALGIGFHVANNLDCRRDVIDAAKDFWNSFPETMRLGRTGGGKRLTTALQVGRNLMAMPLDQGFPKGGS